MPTQRKIDQVAELTDKLGRSQLTLVTDYRGMTVAEITSLRRELSKSQAELVVAKNTLVKIAAQEHELSSIEPLLEGPTALALVYGDITGVVKTINDFNRGATKLTVRGGMLGNSLLKENVLDQVANLPTRQEVLAQVLGGVSSPLSSVVGLISTPVNDVVNIINSAANSILYALQARIDQLQPADEQSA